MELKFEICQPNNQFNFTTESGEIVKIKNGLSLRRIHFSYEICRKFGKCQMAGNLSKKLFCFVLFFLERDNVSHQMSFLIIVIVVGKKSVGESNTVKCARIVRTVVLFISATLSPYVRFQPWITSDGGYTYSQSHHERIFL